jgi:hypothetical protein
MTAALGIGSPEYSAERRPWSTASVYMVAMGAFFYSSYGFANWATSHRNHVPSIVFGWEHRIPFLDWTIVPYWSIDVFYCFSFFVCRTRNELHLHAKRWLRFASHLIARRHTAFSGACSILLQHSTPLSIRHPPCI